MVIFFFTSLIQEQIWRRPEMEELVMPYLKLRKEESYRKALSFIERQHMKRLCVFRQYEVQKQVTHSLQKRVDNKVQQWENLLVDQEEKRRLLKSEKTKTQDITD